MVAFATVVLAFTGCTDGELPGNYYMNVTPNTNQSVAASTTAVNFTVSANVVWEVYVNGDLKHTGTADDNLTYQLTMPANESLTDAVVYNVVFKSADLAYNRTIPVTVTQRAAIDPSQPYLEVSPDADQNVDATTTSFVFAVEANVSWTVKVDGTQQDSGSADKSVTVTFPVNESTTATAVRIVTFESVDPSFDHTVTVNITQAAAAATDTKGVFTSNVGLPSENSSTDAHYIEKATINGSIDQYDILKLGKSSQVGTYTTPAISSTAGNKVLSFYAVAWNNRPGPMKITVNGGGTIDGSTSKEFDITANAGATGNSPYTLTLSDDTDYYQVNIVGATTSTTLTIETTSSEAYRVLITGLNVN